MNATEQKLFHALKGCCTRLFKHNIYVFVKSFNRHVNMEVMRRADVNHICRFTVYHFIIICVSFSYFSFRNRN